MDSCKYIVFESPVNGEFPVLFPAHVKHALISSAIHSAYPGIKAIRAGFVDENLHCYGKSESIKLGGGGVADTLLIRLMLKRDEDGAEDEIEMRRRTL